jgi:hypothetical protein
MRVFDDMGFCCRQSRRRWPGGLRLDDVGPVKRETASGPEIPLRKIFSASASASWLQDSTRLAKATA